MFIMNNGTSNISFIHTVEDTTVTLEPTEAMAVEETQGMKLLSMFPQSAPTPGAETWVYLTQITEAEFLAMEDVATEFWTAQWNSIKSFFGF